MYFTAPTPLPYRPPPCRAAGKSRLRAFSLARGVREGEGHSRSTDLRGEDAAETAAETGLLFDLDLNLRDHHAGIAAHANHHGRDGDA